MQAYTVLARRYRPTTFEDVTGQGHVAQTLQNAIRESRVGHAYLFCGPRGVGKTSMARIFARSLNCAKGPTTSPCGACESCLRVHEGADQDVIEIDAASNRGVEDARQLRDAARYAPLRSRFKIYILDEAHMLTPEAFNTLLKILEEPPPHVKFVFATTEAHKLPATIVSRCQRFEFNRLTLDHIAARLAQVAQGEKLSIAADIFRRVAQAARGSMRDAESLLDQLIAFREDKIAPDDVNLMVGAASEERLGRLFQAVRDGDARRVLETTQEIFARGVDPAALTDQLLEAVRAMLVLKACGRDAPALELAADARDALATLQESFSLESLLYFAQLVMESRRRLREGLHPQMVLELAFVKMSQVGRLVTLAEAVRALQGGAPATPPPARKEAPPAPAPTPPPSAGAPVEGIAARWSALTDAIRGQNVVIATVLADCRPLRLERGTLTVQVPDKFNNSFHRDKIKKLQELKPLLEAATRQVFGGAIALQFEFEASGSGKAAEPAQDPGIKKIVEKFQGIRIIDSE